LPPQVVGQQLALESFTRLGQLTTTCTWGLLEQEELKPNKLQALFLWGGQRKTQLLLKLLTHFELS